MTLSVPQPPRLQMTPPGADQSELVAGIPRPTYIRTSDSEAFLTWAGMREIWNVFRQVVPAFGICCSGQDKLELALQARL